MVDYPAKNNDAPIIFALSKEFGFDYNDAAIFTGLQEIKCLFPFCGKILPGCRGIQWSYGLHTQCQKEIIDDGKTGRPHETCCPRSSRTEICLATS